ncbi:hypothetical protein JTB14_022827 [Gonioctena quinquepunctata]|nr:hypothetical protein JTB14_022827 [Gonioctena quinquepunctata]
MRLSLKTEKVRQHLEKQQELLQQKQQEVKNQMRLIRLEHEVELEVTYESNEFHSSVISEASARLVDVQEWIQGNIELPATEENKLSPIEIKEVCDVSPQKSEKYHGICRPANKTLVMSVKARQTSNNETSDSHGKSHPKSTEFSNVHASNEMKLLCQTISETMKSVNPVTQEKILARQTLDKDFRLFDGNPEDWSLFHQQFQIISTMCQYSGEEIMVKLRKSLRGEAKSSISAMMMTSKNLEFLMETLQMQFGRPELIIDIISSKMSAIPHMKELNIDKLISFSNEVNNLVATIKSLDNYGHYHNPQLLKEFVNKLPDSLKLKWGKTVLLNHGRVNMEKFSLWISDIADAATYVTTPCKKCQGRKAYIVLNAIRSEKFPKAGGIERTRTYCDKKSHSVNTCDKLIADDIDTRWATITSKNLCFSCFKKGHSRVQIQKIMWCKWVQVPT